MAKRGFDKFSLLLNYFNLSQQKYGTQSRTKINERKEDSHLFLTSKWKSCGFFLYISSILASTRVLD